MAPPKAKEIAIEEEENQGNSNLMPNLREVKRKKDKVQGCHFSPKVIGETLPTHYKFTKIREYEGSTDPKEHLARFENVVMLRCYEDKIKCKVFLTTLVDSAKRWFENLGPQSIRSFTKFKQVFLQHFSSSKRYKKTAYSLFEVKKLGEESLRAYIRKFNKAALEVPTCDQETNITALTQGIREGEFFKSLVKKELRTFEDLLAQAEKYINMEEAQKKKKETARIEGSQDKGRMGRLRI
ncbi:uncharacterized protein [Henckelia pumila]|uniref:uncharacterized protein n=1 Tax=Henckelia pumila TaxID=405737 RepID=UPI003C6E334D